MPVQSGERFLLIDIGNTTTKLGIADSEMIHHSIVLPTETAATADRIGLQVVDICRWSEVDPRSLASWLVCSVVPPLDPLLALAGEKFSGCPVRFLTRDIPLELENRYARPEEVGADRLVTAFAARQLYKTSSLIVIDFGTATTFDCVQDNAYLGGLICPGLNSSMRALGTQTAKLPQVNLELSSTDLRIGQSTAESLQSGLLFGFASMVEGLCNRLGKQLAGEVTVVATGGLAKKIAPLCSCLDAIVPDLLLHGMLQAYAQSAHNQGDRS